MRIVIAAVLAMLCPVAVDAQSAPPDELRTMATDRPNATNSPTTIDNGYVQIEFGVFDRTLDRTLITRTTAYSHGDANIRIGVLDNLEINVIVQPHLVMRATDRITGASDGARGVGDLTIGGKLNLWGNDGSDHVWATALGVTSQVTLPTAKRALGSGYVEAGVALPFTMNLPWGFGLSVQPSVSRIRDEADRGYTLGYQGAAAVAHDVGPFNVYLEYVFDDTTEQGAADQQLFDLGATVAVTRNLVVDAGVAIGLNDAADGFRFLTGASIRF